jgi:hypothetical protein
MKTINIDGVEYVSKSDVEKCAGWKNMVDCGKKPDIYDTIKAQFGMGQLGYPKISKIHFPVSNMTWIYDASINAYTCSKCSSKATLEFLFKMHTAFIILSIYRSESEVLNIGDETMNGKIEGFFIESNNNEIYAYVTSKNSCVAHIKVKYLTLKKYVISEVEIISERLRPFIDVIATYCVKIKESKDANTKKEFIQSLDKTFELIRNFVI